MQRSNSRRIQSLLEQLQIFLKNILLEREFSFSFISWNNKLTNLLKYFINHSSEVRIDDFKNFLDTFKFHSTFL